MANKGNLGNKQKPSDVYFVVTALSMDVTVDPPSFSPNSDSIKDKVTISYALAHTSEVIIKIRDSQMETIKEWDVENQSNGVVYQVEWDGKKSDGSSYPDGSYTVIVMSKVLESSGFAYGLEKELTIDNTPPQIIDATPRERSEISALFRVSVHVIDTPKSGGIGFVYATIDNDIESKIPMVKSKTEGEYTIPTTSLLLLPLGSHSVTFHIEDLAGNRTEKTFNYTVVPETKPILNLMNFPNPFPPGGVTTVRYSLPEKAQSGELAIYNAGGDMVFFKDLAVDELESGEHKLQWNGRDMFGNVMGRGIYFCRLSVITETGDKVKDSKIAIR
jgi:flagellar hook assembly protein FlgD